MHSRGGGGTDQKKSPPPFGKRAPLYDLATLTATDIKSGLHLYQSQKVDCVILDLDLSGESGFEALFALIPNRHRPSVPVVVLTKLPYPHLHDMVLHNGAFACLHIQRHSARDLENAIQQAIASIAATS